MMTTATETTNVDLDDEPTETPLDSADLVALIETPAEPVRETDVDADGFVYDLATMEVVGHVDTDEDFKIDSGDKAEWVLQLRSKIEGELAGIAVREQALLAQLKALRMAKVRVLAWWDWKFATDLKVFARRLLEGKKERTARFAWGSVAFRKTSGTNQIVSMDEAVAWMEVWAPEKVKTKTVKTVTIRDVIAVRDKVAKEFGESDEHLGWLKSSEPGENVTISTGIQLETPTGKERKS